MTTPPPSGQAASKCSKCQGKGWIFKGNGNDEECDCIFFDPPESQAAPQGDGAGLPTPRTDRKTTMSYLRGDSQMTEVVTADFARSLERDLATLKAERDEAQKKLRKALTTLKRIGSNQSRYYGSEAMNMYNELSK